MNDLRFLVINTANIGDLLVATPTIAALRQAYPEARIDVFVNSYNAPVMDNNPDIDHLYYYTKAKHRLRNETVLGVHWRRFRLLWELRNHNYDYILLAGNGFAVRPYRLARFVGSRHLIGFSPFENSPGGINMPVLLHDTERHEVIKMLDLLAPLGINPPVKPKMVLRPSASGIEKARFGFRHFLSDDRKSLVAIHISARLPSQRWPANRFVDLIHEIHGRFHSRFVLFWSPGDENDPHHPGDDKKAVAIIKQCKNVPVLAYPTGKLEDLIGGLSLCNAMFCADGGAMHVGAALGLPIVCLFGDSHSNNWHPWGVPYKVLQPVTRDVCDVSVAEAYTACSQILFG